MCRSPPATRTSSSRQLLGQEGASALLNGNNSTRCAGGGVAGAGDEADIDGDEGEADPERQRKTFTSVRQQLGTGSEQPLTGALYCYW